MKFIAGLRVWGNWEIGENVLKVFLRLRGSANRRVDLFLPLIASILCPRSGRGAREEWPLTIVVPLLATRHSPPRLTLHAPRLDRPFESVQTLLDGTLTIRVKYIEHKESVHGVPWEWTGHNGGLLRAAASVSPPSSWRTRCVRKSTPPPSSLDRLTRRLSVRRFGSAT